MQAHIAAYMEALAPAGLLENEFAILIAMDRWRLKRAGMIENSIFAQGWLDHAEALDVDNSLAKGSHTPRATRRSASRVYEPADDFEPASAHRQFVFSASEIARVRDRRDRLDIAWEVINHPERLKKAA